MSIFEKLFGTASQRQIKAITPIVDKIESLAPMYAASCAFSSAVWP